MKSIKTKLIASFLIVVFAVIMVIGCISLESGYTSLKTEAQKTLILLAAEGAKITESRMETMITSLEMIAMKEEIIEMGWEVDLEALKVELKKTSFLDMGYVLPNGYTNYTDGTVRLMSDRSYVKEALKGKASISDIVISRVTRKPEIEICIPVIKDGEVTGAIVARKEADTLGNIVKDSGYGKEGYAFMINGKGRVIASPDIEKVTNLYNPIELAEKDLRLTSLSKAYQTMLDNKSGITSYNQEGTNFYAAYAPIAGTDWIFAITADKSEIFSAIPKLVRTIILAMITVLILCFGLIYLLQYNITRPLIGITKVSKKIASMDLRENISEVYLKQKDEIGILSGTFQSLTLKLREIIIRIAQSANQVTATAQELAATSLQSASITEQISDTLENIAQGASEQANSTEMGFSNASKLGKLIDKNNDYVIELNLSTEEVNEMVKSGLRDVEKLSHAAHENRKATDEICEIILQTKSSSEQIREASKLISEMAGQTHLLALNASIEAARAGAAGRGFAIVAEEIQKMADQSAMSTKYIDDIIKGLMQNVNNSSMSMERIRTTSDEQLHSVMETFHKYQSISDLMKVSKAAVEKMNASEKDINNAKDEILDMLQSLSAIAEQNAAGTQQAASFVEEQTVSTRELAETSNRLSELATDLQSIIDRVQV